MQNGSLEIEAANLFKSGDVKPVARTKFLLLTKDFESILQESTFLSQMSEFAEKKNLKNELEIIRQKPNGNIRLFAMAYKYQENLEHSTEGIAYSAIAVVQGLNAAQQYVSAEVTTDFQGKARFENIKPGTYYVFGYNLTGSEVAIWNLKTEVKNGNSKLILDSKNAEIIR